MDNLQLYRLLPSRASSFSAARFSFYEHLVLPECLKQLVWRHAGRHYRSTLVFRTNARRKSEAYAHTEEGGQCRRAHENDRGRRAHTARETGGCADTESCARSAMQSTRGSAQPRRKPAAGSGAMRRCVQRVYDSGSGLPPAYPVAAPSFSRAATSSPMRARRTRWCPPPTNRYRRSGAWWTRSMRHSGAGEDRRRIRRHGRRDSRRAERTAGTHRRETPGRDAGRPAIEPRSGGTATRGVHGCRAGDCRRFQACGGGLCTRASARAVAEENALQLAKARLQDHEAAVLVASEQEASLQAELALMRAQGGATASCSSAPACRSPWPA